MKNKWLFWDDFAHHPQENMDIDARLLKDASALNGQPLIRFYDWDRPAVSIGAFQKENIVADQSYCIVTRPTGGGVVYHDNEFTYTVVVPKEHYIYSLDRVESYRVLHKAIVKAFAHFGLKGVLVDSEQPKADRATMRCFTTPTKYDILCEEREGKVANRAGGLVKFAGSAQRRTKLGILHQGSIVLTPVMGGKKNLAKVLKNAFEEEFDILFDDFKPDWG